MKLVIVESPTKAKTLASILGKEYKIEASMGHVRDLPKSGLGVDVEHNYEPQYIIPDKATKTIKNLQKLAKEADVIVLATDPDREGEAIAWHILTELAPKKAKKKSKTDTSNTDQQVVRVVFHELTKSAINEAFKHPGELNMNLVDAQQARRVLDRLVGYKLSPLLWKKVRFGLSAGRVQSVAVRLIVERERERTNFKPEEYWSIEGNFESQQSKNKLKADLYAHKGKKLKIENGSSTEKIQTDLKNDSFKIHSVTKSERKKNPYAPYKTSTLQQAGSNVYGFTAKRTMDVAQKLFEKGFITYHRTDSLNLSAQFIESTRGFVTTHFGANFVPEKPIFYKTKSANAQEAHEAVRVTDVNLTPRSTTAMTPEELKIYTLIWKRSLECQMQPAIYDQTTLEILSGKEYGFRTTGSVIKFEGWLAVGKYVALNEDEDEIKALAEFTEGEALSLLELLPEQHFTQPAPRYSDATLIKALEEMGIGRPSTYAPTIQTIQARGYVTKENRYFTPTDVAYVVTDLLVEHFKDVVDYEFTAHLEEDLDLIAEGEKQWVPVIKEFYEPFIAEITEKDKTLQKHDVTNLGESGDMCPECGRPLIYKLGKYGKFISCTGYPECKYAKPVVETISMDGANGEPNANGSEEPQDYGKCDKCDTGVMVLKVGRFGKFIACSNYPKCKNAKPFLNKIGVKCPKCKEGEVVYKKAKRKGFYGCSRYPDCDFASWTKPVEGMSLDELTNLKGEGKTKKTLKNKKSKD